MLISNKSSCTIHIEVISTSLDPEIILQTLDVGDIDDFDVGDTIHIYSETGSCLCVNYFNQEIRHIKNFGNLILEEGPKKHSGISLIISDK